MNVKKGETIADRAIAYLEAVGTGCNTAAIAGALGVSNESARSSLMRWVKKNPGRLTFGGGFWYLEPESDVVNAFDEDAALEAELNVDVEAQTIVDELDEVIDELDGLMDALAALRSIREALPEMLLKARLGAEILSTLDRHIDEYGLEHESWRKA